ncbi:ribonuclease P protein component [Echinicola vietnamensis]|uniref:Ribonuclease P protein component n=1 Tax=Echinicola vietnamensis (strain DSM 17526 / LMG 23754 / KMM 6221) TaxID=926556 RepID=L0FZL6_ECHVK|nr:ribonuclease P protein component [Echinicola vietnamensis]AGA78050.1 RNase P protein component [Echinicola vietnamensis DSM 17526]
MDYRLPKKERLHSQKLIKELFDKGSSFFLYPFKVIYLPLEGEEEANQVLFSVSKRKIRKAVHRNYLKRRMKEAYRLNKSILINGKNNKKLIAFVYVAPGLEEFHKIQSKVQKVLNRLADRQGANRNDDEEKK